MTDPDFSVLRSGGTRTRVQMGCIGCGTWGLGGFMVALHAIPLDPSTRRTSQPDIPYLIQKNAKAVGLKG